MGRVMEWIGPKRAKAARRSAVVICAGGESALSELREGDAANARQSPSCEQATVLRPLTARDADTGPTSS